MTRPGTFGRVYAAIKEQLRGGYFRPGDRLEPAILSDQLNASVTPVRDALHRLTGERLVEAPLHEGFRVPLLTEAMLRHLYAWHRDLVLLAIVGRRREYDADEHQALAAAGHFEFQRQNSIFLALVRMAGNPEHVTALESLVDRLEPVQRLEPLLLDALEEETDEIIGPLEARDRARLRRALLRYHRRRSRIVPLLLERLYSQ